LAAGLAKCATTLAIAMAISILRKPL